MGELLEIIVIIVVVIVVIFVALFMVEIAYCYCCCLCSDLNFPFFLASSITTLTSSHFDNKSKTGNKSTNSKKNTITTFSTTTIITTTTTTIAITTTTITRLDTKQKHCKPVSFSSSNQLSTGIAFSVIIRKKNNLE